MKDNEHLVSMHPMIPGESVLFLGETREGVISLSNFRYINDQIVLKRQYFCNNVFVLVYTCQHREDSSMFLWV